ncbi:MAG: hypothetical protein RL071_1536 [Pseudomonadota bacterium]
MRAAAATLGLALLLAGVPAAAADAPAGLAAEITAAKAAVKAKDWAAAEAALQRAERAAMGASGPVTPADLGSIWMIRGVIFRAQADPKGRYNDQWRQALAVDNSLPWDESLIADGDAFSLFEALRVEVRGRAKAPVGLPAAVGAAKAFVDGQRVKAEDSVLAGVHLAQVTCPDACTYGAWTTLQPPPAWLQLCPGGVDTAAAPAEEDDEFEGMGPVFGVQGGGGGAKACPAAAVAATTAPPLGKPARGATAKADPPARSGGGGGNKGPVILMASGGALVLGAVGLNFGLAAPAWQAIEDARAAPADLTRTEADQLSRSFNVARGLTLGVGVAGLGLGATGLSLQLSERTSLSPTLTPGGAGLRGRF